MYRKALFLLILLAAFFSARGQKLTWSHPIKTADRAMLTEVAGQGAGYVVLTKTSWRHRDRDIIIEVYNDELQRTAQRQFVDKKGERFIKLVVYPQRLQLYYTRYDKPSRQTQVRVRCLNFSLNDDRKDTLLTALPGDDMSLHKLQVFTQPGAAEALLCYHRQAEKVPASLNYMLLDSSLYQLGQAELALQYEKEYDVEQAVYTPLHLLLLIREECDKKTAVLGSRLSLLDGAVNTEKVKRINLYTDSLLVTEGLLKPDRNNNALVFAGLFSRSDSTQLLGCYNWRRDLEKRGRSKDNWTYFPPKVIDEMAGKDRRQNGLPNLRAGTLVLRQDGGYILTTEEYRESRESMMDVNVAGVAETNFRYYYYYQNVLIVSVDTSGRLDWHTVLRKDQVSVNDNGIFSSYAVSVQQDKLMYVYNDFSRKNWSLSLTEIDRNGATSNQILIRPQEYEGRLLPQLGQQAGYNFLVIPCVNRSDQLLLKVTW